MATTDHDHSDDHGGGDGGASPGAGSATPLSFDRFVGGSDEADRLAAPKLYRADLNALNGSGVRGFAEFAHDDATLTARVVARGLEPDGVHIQHIHGAFDEDGNPIDSFTPGPSADVDGDGFLELAEGLPFYGPILLNLTSPPGAGLDGFPTAPDGTVDFQETYDLGTDLATDIDAADLIPLDLREVVIHGLTVGAEAGGGTEGEVDGTAGYKLVLPVASGEIAAVGVRLAGRGGDDELTGGDGNDTLRGGAGDDTAHGGAGDDQIRGGGGVDSLCGDAGADLLEGGAGRDLLEGGTGTDLLYGDDGGDTLMGDSGAGAARGSDLAADRLDGGAGDDRLVIGDGLDTVTGGAGGDTFLFKQANPQTPLAVGTGPAFASVTDFRAGDDTLAFDVAGTGEDTAAANFTDLSGGAGGAAASFYSGGAAGAAGEDVVVLTEVGFASGALAVQAVAGEQAGDMVVYFNTTVGVASLLVVSAPDAATSIARFTDINSVEELAATGFTVGDFMFA
jgi:Ca2+-binding RTX toxin-like protein